MPRRPGLWAGMARTLEGWWSELSAWLRATATPEGAVVAAAVAGLLLFIAGFWLFVFDWDRLIALTHGAGQCVQYLTGPKAAFFIVATLTAALLSVFFIAEAVSLYLQRRRLKRRWSPWLVGLGLSSTLLWLALLYAFSAWCF
ncbi:hypothetical protein JCM16106_14120 [Hydrogenophilus islandicus]